MVEGWEPLGNTSAQSAQTEDDQDGDQEGHQSRDQDGDQEGHQEGHQDLRSAITLERFASLTSCRRTC